MGKCKTKAIETDLGTFRHNQAYPGIIQVYSKPCVTLAYSEPWYILNPDIFKITVCSEVWHIQNSRHIQTSTMKHFVKIVNGK